MNDNTERKEGNVYIAFNGYLESLSGAEKQKPETDRRPVPTVKELAEVVGVHEVTLHNIVNGKVTRLNIDTMQKVLDELWRRGFRPQVTDFIRYVPPETQ